MSKAKQHQKEQNDIAAQKHEAGRKLVSNHPLFYPLFLRARVRRGENYKYPTEGLCIVTNNGYILCNPKCQAEPEQWARALAHCLLHLGMDHFKEKENPAL